VTTAASLAALAGRAGRPLLVGLDIDGTLASIVEHPDHARLVAGAFSALDELAARPDTIVAVVSGRAYADIIERFAFPHGVTIIGSHGLETDPDGVRLDRTEERRLAAVRALLEPIVDTTPGSWIEDKPAGVVLHHRECDPEQAAAAARRFERALRPRPGVFVLPGHEVVEAMVRRPSKAAAVVNLQMDTGSAAVVYAGDDRTDEEVFAALAPRDLTVKVGLGATVARHRLAGPSDVAEFAARLAATS
jgi:trehalose 6-phosphate phosphatase